MKRDDLLARIRKCLALAKSANEHEAAAALATARRLIDEHGVDQADVDAIDVGVARQKGSGAWTPSQWETYLIYAVRRAIPVEAINHGDEGWSFIGITPAPEIAAYAFTTLYRQLRRARTDYIATKLKRVATARRKTVRADAFAEGWALAVRAAIAAIYPKSDLDPIVRKYIERLYPKVTSFTPRGAAIGAAGESDRGAGWSQGKDARLAHGVTGAAPARLELAQ